MLDLNGKTLTYDYSNTDTAMMTLSEGSSVTILNGTIVSAANKVTANSVGFQVTGGELTLSGVTTSGIGGVVNVKDSTGTGTDSKVRLLDCTIDAEDIAIYMTGNGTASDDLSQLVVEGCTINAKFAGVYGNGSASAWGTDITVGNTTITGGYTGIYHPQKDSTLTIYNSTITSYTGVAIKGGYVSIIDSIITGTGGDGNAVTNITPSQSGFFDTGDGVYVETNYGWPIEVEIYNSTVSATGGGLAVRQYLVEDSHASIVIYSGTFSSQVDSSHIFSGSTQTQDTSGYKVAVNTESTP